MQEPLVRFNFLKKETDNDKTDKLNIIYIYLQLIKYKIELTFFCIYSKV
jgi:hypothetical protein